MKVLGLEASTAAGSVALLDGEDLVGELWLTSTSTHSERLLQGVDWLLRGAGLATTDLQGVAVGLGPGSFTGLRIALSTAKGLALALGVPLAGISTLEALACNLPWWAGAICALVDARRGMVYGGVFRSTREQGVERLESEGLRELSSWLGTLSSPTIFLGDGARVYRDTIRRALGDGAFFAPPELMHPRAAVVARLGYARLSERGGDDVDSLVPRYIQKSPPERESPSLGDRGL